MSRVLLKFVGNMLRQSKKNLNVYTIYDDEELQETQQQIILVDDPNYGHYPNESPSKTTRCSYCGKQLSARFSLFRHLRSVHPEIAEDEIGRLFQPKKAPAEPFACQFCGRPFGVQPLLFRHLKDYHPDQADDAIEQAKDKKRKFACESCGLRFKLRIQLLEHVRIHHPDVDLNASKRSNAEKEKKLQEIACKESGCVWKGTVKRDLQFHLEAAHGKILDIVRDKTFPTIRDFKRWCNWVERRPGKEVRLCEQTEEMGSSSIHKECHTNLESPKEGENAVTHCTLYIRAEKNGSDGSVTVQHACLSHYGHEIEALPNTSSLDSTTTSSLPSDSDRTLPLEKASPLKRTPRKVVGTEPASKDPLTILVYKKGNEMSNSNFSAKRESSSKRPSTSVRLQSPKKRMTSTPSASSRKGSGPRDLELESAVESIAQNDDEFHGDDNTVDNNDVPSEVDKEVKEKLKILDTEITTLSRTLELFKKESNTTNSSEISTTCQFVEKAYLALHSAMKPNKFYNPEHDPGVEEETAQSDNFNDQSFY